MEGRRTVSSSCPRLRCNFGHCNVGPTREQIDKAKHAIDFLSIIDVTGAWEEMAGSTSESGCSSSDEGLFCKQRSRLIFMIDTLDMPTIFFTQIGTYNQWPKLACLIADLSDSSFSRSCAMNKNPAIADLFFY